MLNLDAKVESKVHLITSTTPQKLYLFHAFSFDKSPIEKFFSLATGTYVVNGKSIIWRALCTEAVLFSSHVGLIFDPNRFGLNEVSLCEMALLCQGV